MGKYDKILGGNDNARALTVSNIYIANELAEANRLKRVELEMLARKGGFHALPDETKFMEDKA